MDEKVSALEIGKDNPEAPGLSGHIHSAYSGADNDRQGLGGWMNQSPSILWLFAGIAVSLVSWQEVGDESSRHGMKM